MSDLSLPWSDSLGRRPRTDQRRLSQLDRIAEKMRAWHLSHGRGCKSIARSIAKHNYQPPADDEARLIAELAMQPAEPRTAAERRARYLLEVGRLEQYLAEVE
jgi:hypothetical protein